MEDYDNSIIASFTIWMPLADAVGRVGAGSRGAGDDKIGTSKGGGGGGKSGKDWTTLTRLLAPSSGLRASIAIDVENLLCAMF